MISCPNLPVIKIVKFVDMSRMIISIEVQDANIIIREKRLRNSLVIKTKKSTLYAFVFLIQLSSVGNAYKRSM